MDWLKENFWLIMFVAWGMPLGWFRSKFRKIVYQTDDWMINIKPLFIKELKGFFSNLYSGDDDYLKTRNQYRVYLAVYLALFLIYKFSH